MSIVPPAFFIETLAAWGISLSSAQLAQFAAYATALQMWNERANLTAITATEDIYLRHFLDALACTRGWADTPQSLVDIGSGAGFPGIPLKLLHPELQLTLIESVGKKVAFLTHVRTILALEHVVILQERAEQIGHNPQHRECYDVATARAVAELRVLAEYGLPLVRVGGRLLAPKGPDVTAEVPPAQQALAALGGQVLTIEPVTLPGLEPRTLVVVAKHASTPPKYPRAVGVPARRPL